MTQWLQTRLFCPHPQPGKATILQAENFVWVPKRQHETQSNQWQNSMIRYDTSKVVVQQSSRHKMELLDCAEPSWICIMNIIIIVKAAQVSWWMKANRANIQELSPACRNRKRSMRFLWFPMQLKHLNFWDGNLCVPSKALCCKSRSDWTAVPGAPKL